MFRIRDLPTVPMPPEPATPDEGKADAKTTLVWISRDKDGNIDGIFGSPQAEHWKEQLDFDDPEVVAYRQSVDNPAPTPAPDPVDVQQLKAFVNAPLASISKDDVAVALKALIRRQINP